MKRGLSCLEEHFYDCSTKKYRDIVCPYQTFFITLKSSINVDIQNGLAFLI